MSEDERRNWDSRYATGDYQPRPTAGPFLEDWIDRLPSGRALDIACGAGRHAMRLAEAGLEVEAVDVSAVAIDMARTQAKRRGHEITWIVADLDEHQLPSDTFDVIAVIRYVNRSLWPRLVDALAPGGWLLVEHHMKTNAEVDGPSSPEFRLEPQELLNAFADLRVIFYEELLTDGDRPGRRHALQRLVAVKDGPGW